MRRQRGLGPARIAGIVDAPASTVHRVLVRHHLNRLDHLDRVTRVPIRRLTMSRPGELVHVDIKKLGRIPKGGGWKVYGRAARPSTYRTRVARIGYAYVHSAVDDHTRLAFSEIHSDESGIHTSGARSGGSTADPATVPAGSCALTTTRTHWPAPTS